MSANDSDHKAAAEHEEMKQSAASHAEEEGEDEDDEDEEEEEDGELGFINNHDLIGVKGIITAQKNEIEKKKVS